MGRIIEGVRRREVRAVGGVRGEEYEERSKVGMSEV